MSIFCNISAAVFRTASRSLEKEKEGVLIVGEKIGVGDLAKGQMVTTSYVLESKSAHYYQSTLAQVV